jgi:TPR repeat protein
LDGVRDGGDSRRALELYRESAEKGNAHSQAQLGRMLLLGVGADRDYKLALEWFRKSADQGNGDAQVYLGHMHEKGLGVERDMEKAFEFYAKSAAQGNALGQIRLGDLYLNGSGVDQNSRKALACYQKSADQGKDAESAGLAHLRLGAMFCQGRGVEKDLKKGFEFYYKAAKLGNTEAQLCVGRMYRDGVGVERNHKKALEWFQKSAGKSTVPSNKAMGDLYRDGLVVERNIAEAIRWYKKAAEEGDKYAKTELLKLQQEESIEKKIEAGLALAGKGDAQATAEAANIDPSGMGVEKSEEKPLELVEKAVADENVPVPGERQQAALPISTELKVEKKIPERKKQRVVPPSRIRETKKARPPRTLLYLFPAAGLIGLSLLFIFFGSGEKADRNPASLMPRVQAIAVPPLPELQSILPAMPEPVIEAPKQINARESSPKPSAKRPAPVVESAPAAVKTVPVLSLLRREYKSLDEGAISEMLTAKNLFDAGRNPAGNFQHRYEIKNVAGLRLIIDRATNLVWTRQQSPVKMNLGKSIQWIGSLNHAGYGGHGKWRLPTVEEAASLLKKNTDGGKLFLDAVFGVGIEAIWTGDSSMGSESWVVDFQDGTIKSGRNRSRLMTLMVSSEPDSFSEQIPIQ